MAKLAKCDQCGDEIVWSDQDEQWYHVNYFASDEKSKLTSFCTTWPNNDWAPREGTIHEEGK